MQKFYGVVFIIFSLLIQTAYAAPEFPELTGRIVDQAQIIDESTEIYLQNLLQQHENKSTQQIVIVTLNSLQGYDIADYGYQLGRYWKIGKSKLNNGVLLIIAPNERKVRIEVGYGLESVLTDGLSHQIIQNTLLPAFRLGNFQQGIRQSAEDIIELLELNPQALEERKQKVQPQIPINDLYGLLIFALFFFAPFLRAIVKRFKYIALLAISSGIAVFVWWLTTYLFLAIFAFIFCMVLLSVGGSGFSTLTGSYRGGGFGGGGFGGGGGSFGGGGASGGW